MRRILKIAGSTLIWIGLTQLVLMLAWGYAHGTLLEAFYYIGAVGVWMAWTWKCLEWLFSVLGNEVKE